MQTTYPVNTPPTGNRPLLRFLLVTVALYIGWVLAYEQWLSLDGKLDMMLCNQLTDTSVALLRAFSFAAAVDGTKANLVLMNGQPSVITFAACNGLVLYALFAGFVLAFPGPWKHKAWYIPLGIAFIWVLNVLRIAVLALNHHYARQSVDFNHHYTFNFVVYGCLFGLWMLWARYLAFTPRQLAASSTLPGNA